MTFHPVLLASVLVSMILLAGFGVIQAAGPEAESDAGAIRSLIAGMGEDWNQPDMNAWTSRFVEQADVVNRFGQPYQGRARALKHLAGLHESAFKDQLVGRMSTVESVRLIRPDIAVAHEVANEGPSKSLTTYLLSKKDGRGEVESCTVNVSGTPGEGRPPSR